MKTKSSIVDVLLKRPYFIFSFLILFLFLGAVGYNKLDKKLFPDSNYPTIAVVAVEPGASAKSIATNIAIPIEEELYTLDNIRRVYSSTIDEVSVISAEFDYIKDIDTAASDISNALNKIKSDLPSSLKEPKIIKITSSTAPIITYAVSSKDGQIPLEDIRQLVQTKIKHNIVKLDGVANVDIFGGYQKEIQIIVDKKKLDKYSLDIAKVIAKIKANDNDFAIGFMTSQKSRFLIRTAGKKDTISKLKNISITQDITLGDISKVYFGYYENSAEYFGNQKPSIAIAVQRTDNADVIRTIDLVQQEIDKLAKKYKNIELVITDTQKDTIVQSINNMFESLRDAIIMSIIVVFFFLASFRQVFVVLVTIPLVYASTIALMWIFGIEFNVVTLTAIILALGLLLDDAVVVMENIERHYRELKEDIHTAVYEGTKEIMFADLSGTITTMIALSPMLFIGGYPQTVFQPLVSTLLLALAASYVISITAVPLLSLKILTIDHSYILKSEAFFKKITEVFYNSIANFFQAAVKKALSNRFVGVAYIQVLIILFVISLKGVMPTVGQELMPPMDTGALKVNITVDPNLTLNESRKIASRVSKIIKNEAELLYLSTTIGSEAGVMSIGSGSGTDHISIIATYVDRYSRKKSIWDIAKELRKKINNINNIYSVDVVDFGATALSSIRANLDVTLSSDDLDKLQVAGKLVEDAMQETKGIVSVSKTWSKDKLVYEFDIDEKKASFYNLNNEEISKQLQSFIRGAVVANFFLSNSKDFKIRVWVDEDKRDSIDDFESFLLNSPKGKIPLEAVATIKRVKEPTIITREGLKYTLNVYGFREKAAISHIMSNFEKAFKGKVLPEGVTMEQTGDIKQFKDSAGRMGGAIAFAIILILFTLIALFNSIKISMMIVFSIPLTIIGASWILLFMNYHTSMPAMMGFILLSGIIVNNAILLIHFALEKMKEGLNKTEAMLESIKIRTRPVLMTAFATSAGMLPVALGSAIGLERLAPLGAVAIGGLIVGTFLTLLYIPLVFIWTTKDIDSKVTLE